VTAALDWQESAVCQSVDPELFFPEKGGSTREAKRVCAGCDARAECLAFALATDGAYTFGVFGGLTARERRQLKPGPGRGGRQRAIRHGTEGGYYAHIRRGEQTCQPCRDAMNEAHRARAERRRRNEQP